LSLFSSALLLPLLPSGISCKTTPLMTTSETSTRTTLKELKSIYSERYCSLSRWLKSRLSTAQTTLTRRVSTNSLTSRKKKFKKLLVTPSPSRLLPVSRALCSRTLLNRAPTLMSLLSLSLLTGEKKVSYLLLRIKVTVVHAGLSHLLLLLSLLQPLLPDTSRPSLLNNSSVAFRMLTNVVVKVVATVQSLNLLSTTSNFSV
jgi:hypothetical protein